MSVMAAGVRQRSFKTVLGGFDPDGVRAALDAAATAFERLKTETAQLRQQHAEALREIDRISELERSLLRSCVAAEEDARIRCGAARRYATRLIAAAREQAAARLDAPARERDRVVREIETMVAQRRHAAEQLERLIAGLEHVIDFDAYEDKAPEIGSEAPAAAVTEVATATPPQVTQFDESRIEPPPSGAPRPTDPERHQPPAETDGVAAPAATGRAADEAGGIDPLAARTDTGADDRPEAAVPDPWTAAPVGTPARTPRPPRFRLPVAAGSAAALLLMFQGSAGVIRPDRTPSISGASFGPAGRAAATTAAPPDADMAPGAVLQAPAQTTPAAAAPLTIRIKPLRTCWVRVVVDDRTDARELQPGEDIVLEAQRSVVLRAGDAGALSVELNGRVLPPLGLNGQVVERRFTAAAGAPPAQ